MAAAGAIFACSAEHTSERIYHVLMRPWDCLLTPLCVKVRSSVTSCLTGSGKARIKAGSCGLNCMPGFLQMGIPLADCHFGYFDLQQLHKAYSILQSISDYDAKLVDGKLVFEPNNQLKATA